MKNIYSFGLMICCMVLPGVHTMAQSHEIRIALKNWKDTTLYLGNYYGSKTYLVDSTRINANGMAVFSGPGLLPPGFILC